jgi:hypothetical protein
MEDLSKRLFLITALETLRGTIPGEALSYSIFIYGPRGKSVWQTSLKVKSRIYHNMKGF